MYIYFIILRFKNMIAKEKYWENNTHRTLELYNFS